MFSDYLADTNKKNIWTKRIDDSFWSTGLYLINREKLRPIIDSIVHTDPLYPSITQYTLIASRRGRAKYIPYECTTTAKKLPATVCIPIYDIVADRFVYTMTTTYVSRLPLAYARPIFKSTV